MQLACDQQLSRQASASDLQPVYDELADQNIQDEDLVELLPGVNQLAEFLENLLADYVKAYYALPIFDDYYRKYFRPPSSVDKCSAGYVTCYKAFSVQSRDQLEQIWSKMSMHSEGLVQLALQRVVLAERKWDDFLANCDTLLNKDLPDNFCVDKLDLDATNLVDCDTQQTIPLRNILHSKYGRYTLFVFLGFFGSSHCAEHVEKLEKVVDKFHQKLCNVVLVCRATKDGGIKWKKITGVTLPLLADESSQFVTTLCFRRSIYGIMQSKMLATFAAAALAHREQKIIEDPRHDIYTLGGDVLVDNAGSVLYYFQSKNIYDRPEPEFLLEKIPAQRLERMRRASLAVRKRVCAIL